MRPLTWSVVGSELDNEAEAIIVMANAGATLNGIVEARTRATRQRMKVGAVGLVVHRSLVTCWLTSKVNAMIRIKRADFLKRAQQEGGRPTDSVWRMLISFPSPDKMSAHFPPKKGLPRYR